MSVHDELRAVLREEAARVEPPELDLAALVDDLERAAPAAPGRRRLAWASAVTTTPVVVALVVWAVLAGRPGPDAPPAEESASTVESLTVGHTPWIPHCREGQLVTGSGTPYGLPCGTLVHRGGATLSLAGDGIRVLRPDGTAQALSEQLHSSWVPAISQDGALAAWTVTEGSYRGRVLVHELATGRQVVSARLPSWAVWVPGFDAGGRLHAAEFEPPYRRWVVDVGSGDATEVRGRPVTGGPVTFLTPDGFATGLEDWFDNQVPRSSSEVGRVTATGAYVRESTVPIGWATWSPSWERLVHETRAGWISQRVDDPSRAVRLRLPEQGRAVALPVWESEHMLLVVFDPDGSFESIQADPDQGFGVPADRTWVLRCSAITGHCESALPAGHAGGLVGSPYR